MVIYRQTLLDFFDNGSNTNEIHTTWQTSWSNNWTHFAITCAGTACNLYANGVLQATGTVTRVATGGGLVISGSNPSCGSGAYCINGSLDEVRVSNVARSASDIHQAFEISRRTHPITIDFVNSLNASNLIADSSDLSFAVNDATYLYLADKVIVKENIGGTEYPHKQR